VRKPREGAAGVSSRDAPPKSSRSLGLNTAVGPNGLPSVIGAGRLPYECGSHPEQQVVPRITVRPVPHRRSGAVFLMIKSKSEGENICVKNCRRYTIPVRWSRISIRCGWTTAASRRTPTRRRSPFPSSCLPQTSPASCTWATPWTAPCRISSSASSAWRATPPCGYPAWTTPASPPRSRWKRSCAPRRA
jgi:hypothetical protein